MTDTESGMTKVLNGSGLPAKPKPQDPRQYSGELVAAQGATEVAAAIERACEATIERMYESVKQNEDLVKDQRQKVDAFAKVLRDYYKTHVTSLSEFMAHLQRTSDHLGEHVKGYEDRLRASAYPRAGDD